MEEYQMSEKSSAAVRPTISIKQIGITDSHADAVVNAANEGLWAGSGVCGAIFNAAGTAELTAACSAIGHCDTGSAVITPGFRLSQYIIHAVGPRWGGDEQKVRKQLYSCYQTSLRLAAENGCRSICFPLISAGVFGVPVEIAWRKALQACLEFPGDIGIIFAIPNENILKTGREMLTQMIRDEEPAPAGDESGNMIIFHDVDKPYGFLSNWCLSDFRIGDTRYSSVEQYLMFRKAELFHDTIQMNNILSTDDPSAIQKYGKAVKPYQEVIWNGMRAMYLYQAVEAKFRQNPDLAKQLKATGDAILVEGTSTDHIYANGLKRDDPDRFDMDKWQGKNLLGFTLMEVRKWLK